MIIRRESISLSLVRWMRRWKRHRAASCPCFAGGIAGHRDVISLSLSLFWFLLLGSHGARSLS